MQRRRIPLAPPMHGLAVLTLAAVVAAVGGPARAVDGPNAPHRAPGAGLDLDRSGTVDFLDVAVLLGSVDAARGLADSRQTGFAPPSRFVRGFIAAMESGDRSLRDGDSPAPAPVAVAQRCVVAPARTPQAPAACGELNALFHAPVDEPLGSGPSERPPDRAFAGCASPRGPPLRAVRSV